MANFLDEKSRDCKQRISFDFQGPGVRKSNLSFSDFSTVVKIHKKQ
jgi:hypothetical protein